MNAIEIRIQIYGPPLVTFEKTINVFPLVLPRIIPFRLEGNDSPSSFLLRIASLAREKS